MPFFVAVVCPLGKLTQYGGFIFSPISQKGFSVLCFERGHKLPIKSNSASLLGTWFVVIANYAKIIQIHLGNSGQMKRFITKLNILIKKPFSIF